MIAGTGLEDLVTIADDPVALRQMVQQAWETEFTDEMVSRRRAHPALPDKPPGSNCYYEEMLSGNSTCSFLLIQRRF